MPSSLLVISPSVNFGETIRRMLEDAEMYRVHIVSNKTAAVVRLEEEDCRIALLDLAMGEDWAVEIGRALRSVRPDIQLVVLADEAAPPSLDRIRPWSLVRKPFQLDTLLTSLSQLEAAPGVPGLQNLQWINDVSKAAQHLTRLTLASAAQAALITRSNELWAYAGGLSQEAAREIAHIVSRSWDSQRPSDLLRFIRLDSTRAEHMLFATRLAADAVLALVFDAETPFSTIRSQASELMQHIGEPGLEPPAPLPAPTAVEPSSTEPAAETDEGADVETPPISEILTDIPSPDPGDTGRLVPPERKIEWPHDEEQAAQALGETRVSPRLSDAGLIRRPPPKASSPEKPSTEDAGMRRERVQVDAGAKPSKPAAPPAPAPEGATRLSPSTEAARKVALEPVSAGLYHLTYACLLVPRFASHYLTGDVSDRLSDWLPTICVAFGWRLEFLAVRPEYLQWVVNVQPNTAPGYVMRVMREQTSEKIFHAFPRKARENPSGDFWAPGYLIMGGSQPHPPQLVRDYIRQIRERQGQESRQHS